LVPTFHWLQKVFKLEFFSRHIIILKCHFFSFKMRYNIWIYCEYNLQNWYTWCRSKSNIWGTAFFSRFNLKKTRLRQKKWFVQLWVKTLYHITYIKNGSNNFKRKISIFKIVNVLVNQKKWETRSWSKSWMRILAKLTSELYQQQLISVNDALEEKRPFTGSGRRPVTLLQDNARSHKTKKILETIADLG